MMKVCSVLIVLFICFACSEAPEVESAEEIPPEQVEHLDVELIVLGTVQDAGSPHIACTKDCCKELFEHPDESRKVVCLGLIDHVNKKSFLFEATPDVVAQMKFLKRSATFSEKETPDGIFLTHAHIGHYAGLMYLGKEAMNADQVPVYAMPRMQTFLSENGPWSQLVNTNNILLSPLENGQTIELTSSIKITPFTVPHRDEYSETVGYTIEGPNKKVLFIPDIDKWEKWETSIIEVIKGVDYAFVDATFYDGAEINNRDISEIPHPFIIESLELFKDLSDTEKSKIIFTHFNHTNPVLNRDSEQAKEVLKKGFGIAKMGDVLGI